jgi:hypothetical protein
LKLDKPQQHQTPGPTPAHPPTHPPTHPAHPPQNNPPQVNAVFSALFNAMGLYPLVYAALLIPAARSNKVGAGAGFDGACGAAGRRRRACAHWAAAAGRRHGRLYAWGCAERANGSAGAWRAQAF